MLVLEYAWTTSECCYFWLENIIGRKWYYETNLTYFKNRIFRYVSSISKFLIWTYFVDVCNSIESLRYYKRSIWKLCRTSIFGNISKINFPYNLKPHERRLIKNNHRLLRQYAQSHTDRQAIYKVYFERWK